LSFFCKIIKNRARKCGKSGAKTLEIVLTGLDGREKTGGRAIGASDETFDLIYFFASINSVWGTLIGGTLGARRSSSFIWTRRRAQKFRVRVVFLKIFATILSAPIPTFGGLGLSLEK